MVKDGQFMNSLKELSETLQARRKALGLNQKDMLLKIGMKQQQYQRIESGGDVRLSTLFRILEGMDMELILAPRDQLDSMHEGLEPSGEKGDSYKNSSWASVFHELDDDL